MIQPQLQPRSFILFTDISFLKHNPLEITHTTQVKLSSEFHDQDVKEITKDQIFFSFVGDLC